MPSGLSEATPSDAGAGFRFPSVPRPARGDAASGATFRVVAGRADANGGGVTVLNFERARYDGNHRISANFLNWVVEKHGREVVVKLNAAAREGRYRDELWRELTGKTVEELGEAWREANRVRLGL